MLKNIIITIIFIITTIVLFKIFDYINNRGTVEFMTKKEDYFYGKHFEALGSAWNALYGDSEEFVRNYLVKSVEKGKFYFNEKSGKKTIFCLGYSEDPNIQILSYIEQGKPSNTHISTCPILKGAKNKVLLKDTHDWSNGVEGEMAVESTSENNLILNFFNPLYLIDKKKFKKDIERDVYLAGVAEVAIELEERDDVYTEGAPYDLYLQRFLEENPDKTEADFEPPVIQMRAEHFRMYSPHDTTSVVEIAGLIEDIEYTEFLGKKVAVLKVNLEHREDNEYLYVNVYVSEHILKNYTPEIGKGIVAVIWLTGYFEPWDTCIYLQENTYIEEQEDLDDKEEKKFYAFGVYGGLGAMLVVFLIKLISNPVVWLSIWHNIIGK